MNAMSSAAPLDYSTPAHRRRVRVRPSVALLWIAIALLGIDIFVLGLPAFGTFYTGSPMLPVTQWAHFALRNARWVSSAFAIVTIVASFYDPRRSWPLRLARSIAVSLAVYHWFFAPGDGAYGRLLWGSC
jgi:hypothetical protein